MDLTNLFAIYGVPKIQECPECHGDGCSACGGFGYLAVAKNMHYSFTYPMHVALKKRNQITFRKNIVTISLTCLLILALVLSYIINIANHG